MTMFHGRYAARPRERTSRFQIGDKDQKAMGFLCRSRCSTQSCKIINFLFFFSESAGEKYYIGVNVLDSTLSLQSKHMQAYSTSFAENIYTPRALDFYPHAV